MTAPSQSATASSFISAISRRSTGTCLPLRGSVAESGDPALHRLFAFGIDPEPGCLPSDSIANWPSVDQVRAYKDHALPGCAGRAQ